MLLEDFRKELGLLKVFYVAQLVDAVGDGLLLGLVFIYFLAIGLAPFQVALLVSMLLLSFVFEIPTGAFADYYGRRASVIVAYVGMGILNIAVPFFDSFPVLLVIMFFSGDTFDGLVRSRICEALSF